jgi:hypothetical protein
LLDKLIKFYLEELDSDYNFDSPTTLSECGTQIINSNNTGGIIDTHEPYPAGVQCSWKIESKCDSIKWKFTKFSIEDAADRI